jgi:hypothetical protein
MHFRVKNILKINHNYIPKYPKYNWFNFLVFLLSVQIILVTRFIFNIVYLFLVVKVMLLRIIQPWRDECSKFRHLNAEGYLFLTHLHSFFYFFLFLRLYFLKKSIGHVVENNAIVEKHSQETTTHSFEWEVSHLYSSQITSLYSFLQRDATFKITTHTIHALNVVTN